MPYTGFVSEGKQTLEVPMPRFNAHDKRVTLNLALHSAVARNTPGLVEALEATKEAGWDFANVLQAHVEVIYATFDDAFEAAVKAEFEADPNYLIDLGPGCPGTCPLCGHNPIRWVFRVANKAGGSAVECGSECIVTWGISVKGAETAEAAKAILESQIRKAIRKLLIEAWHKETGFEENWFDKLRESMDRIHADPDLEWSARRRTYWMKGDVRKLERFYHRTGWLNTGLRWNELGRLVNFCRANDGKMTLPHLDRWVSKADKTKATMAAAGVTTEALAPKVKPDVRPAGTLELPLEAPKVEAAEVAPVVETITPIDEPATPEFDPEAEARELELAWTREQAAALRGAPATEAETFILCAPEKEGEVLVGFLGKALVEAADAAMTRAADLAECKEARLETEADGITLTDEPPSYPTPVPAPKAAQLTLDFNAVCRDLVFGSK